MSLIESPYASTREQIHSSLQQDGTSSSSSSNSSYTASPAAAHPTTSQTHYRQDSFDDVIYEEFFQALEEHRQQPVTKSNMAAAALQESRPMMFETSAADASSTTPASPPAPPLPNKNVRRSRILDDMMLKIDTRRESATPHDVYLSSEEDASSSADDFSDYDWESSSEVDVSEGVEVCEGKLAVSPTTNSSASSPAIVQSRRSHEITARAVAVVFSGKPAIIELSSCSKRSASPSETNKTPTKAPAAAESTTDLTSSASSVITMGSSRAESVTPTTDEDELPHFDAPLSSKRMGSLPSNNSSTSTLSFSRRMSASSASSVPSRLTTADKVSRRQSSTAMFTAMLASKQQQQQPPPFLSVDPYANGSTYSLAASPARKSSLSVVSPQSAAGSEVSPTTLSAGPAAAAPAPKTPKTPTAMFKEFSRSFSNTLNRKRSRQSLMGTSTSSFRDSYVLSSPMPPIDDDAVSEYGPSVEIGPATPDSQRQPQRPRTAVVGPSTSASLQRPERRDSLRSTSTGSPTPVEKKAAAGSNTNRWSALSVRRRSMKLAGKIL